MGILLDPYSSEASTAPDFQNTAIDGIEPYVPGDDLGGIDAASSLFASGLSLTVSGVYNFSALTPPVFSATGYTLFQPPVAPDVGDLPTLNPVTAPAFAGTSISLPQPPQPPATIAAPSIPTIGAPAYGGGDYNSPDFSGSEPALPDYPSTPPAPGLKDIAAIIVDQPPDISATKPTLTIPAAPTPFDKLPPTMNALQPTQLPATPNDALPDAPVLELVTLPDTPQIITPDFTAVLEGGPADPTAEFAWTSSEYQSDLLDSLKERLNYWLESQGTGMDDAIWQSIWQRAKEREDGIALKARMEASEEIASRGFSLPNGSLLAHEQKIIQANQDKSSSLSRDAAIKQAEAEIEQMRFTATEISRLELGLAENDVAIQRLSFEGAKTAIEIALSLYSAQVNKYNADVQAYRTEAEVFKTRFESEKIKLDLYRSELEGEKIKGELNTQKIQNYAAQISAVQATFDLYRTQLEGARFTIDENAQLIEKFKADIEGYAVEARTASVKTDIYSATVNAEKLKIDSFGSEVQAYQAQIAAYSSLTQANTQAKQQEISVESFKIDKFKAEIDGVNAEIGGLSAQLQGAVSIFDTQVRRYAADVDGEARRVTAEVGVHSANIDAFKAEVNRDVSAAGVDVEASKANAQLYGSEVQGFASQVDAETRRYEGDVSKFRADIEGFKATGDRDVAGARIATEGVVAKTQVYDAEVRGYVGLAGAESSRFSAEVGKYSEDINKYQVAVRQDIDRATVALNEYLGVLQSADARLAASSRLQGQIGSASISAKTQSTVQSMSVSNNESNSKSEQSGGTSNFNETKGATTLTHAGGTVDQKTIHSYSYDR